MSLFKLLDDKETKKKVYQKLEQYRTLKSIAGRLFYPRVTATYSFEPRSYTGVVNNAIENHVVRQMTASKEMSYIEEAINGIHDADERKIIILKYCDHRELSDIAIYTDMEYTETEFYRLLNKAVFRFAETYKHGQLLVFEGGKTVDEILGDN